MSEGGSVWIASGADHACASPVLVGVGDGAWYPSDRYSRSADARSVVQACTHLVCDGCGATVSSEAQAFARRYACACAEVEVRAPRPAFWPDADEMIHVATRWRCGGHPALRWERAPPTPRHAEDALAALGVVGPDGERLQGARAWAWLYASVEEGERGRIAGWAAQHARRERAADLSVAIDFFLWVPACLHDGVLLEIEDRVRAAAAQAGEAPGASLWRRWVEAVVIRWIRTRDDPERAAPWRARAMALALKPPGLGAWVRVIEREEPAWYAEHREALAGAGR
jgi:hypothetical protein